jgi:beta-lactamase class A
MHLFTVSPLIGAIMDLISGSTPVRRDDVARIHSHIHPVNEIQGLTDSLEGTRLSRPRLVSHREEPAQRLTVLSVSTPFGVAADLYLTEAADGSLDGFRLVTPTPQLPDPGSFREALRVLDADVAVCVRDGRVRVDDPQVKAISSLIKIFVLLAVLRAVEAGELRLEDHHVLTEVDISRLSAGLTARHVGSQVTVAELCSLMTLRSDNTAMDVLLRLVGTEYVLAVMAGCGVDPGLNTPLRSTRDTLELAWGPRDDHQLTAGEMTLVHARGLDYYAPLGAVADALEQLAGMGWTPWPLAQGFTHPVMYKGGSAPGLLSAAWCQAGSGTTRSVLFAVNSASPLGILEEIYAFTCAERLLGELRIIH